MSGNAPFPIDESLTAIALAYSNEKLIADMVLPRVPVLKQEFKYNVYAKGDAFTIPDSRVGRKSKPNEVEFGATEATGSVVSFGLDHPIPHDDIVNAEGRFDIRGRATTMLTSLIAVGREKRVADMVFDPNNYAATTNKSTLSSGSQWSHADSNPVKAIQDAMDGMLMRPNVMVIGRGAFSALARHAKVVAAAIPMGGNAATGGFVNRQAIANLFELDEVLVGEGWLNTAKPGQTVSMARIWGKHCALLCRDKDAGVDFGVSFGFTAEWQGRVAGSIEDPHIGLRGGERIRAGESVKELVIANDLGYLFIDAAA